MHNGHYRGHGEENSYGAALWYGVEVVEKKCVSDLITFKFENKTFYPAKAVNK